MTTEFKIVEEPKKPLAMHPKKFAMWLFVASVGMLFAALTSAYIVRQAEGNWLYFNLPATLYWTTAVILVSSVTMQMAYWAAKNDQLERVKSLVVITTGLGVVFLVGQLVAWKDLVAQNVYFVGNPSGSFLYVLTGLHGLHIVSALVYLIIVLVSAYRFKIHSKSLAQIEMCTTYWHFLGGLWLYLFIFLLLNR
ncbi:MAG TPA: cytochrome oxidase subunit III [Cytophagales bacterium]|nr:cytochrome oxidase subunit III [Cytophagales bacterium]HCR54626.1 cytochrome oxidase subunit III [Cytophagales bacterium]